ncbi:MAG: bifunctional 2-polyprenyl-6-hydroxyphenol methylase/3-demethylubiquinol 3-O-methyltransferase UbiG [Proteobacteria bacterium]|nr:bifunctional 2-polyprenyl-6-hydroxyphenol methylase/3-demethylubiquinol 3-O-methyltransferase UbiG [Pseudomonadota bacterium]
MAETVTATHQVPQHTSIDAGEVAKFTAMAAEWWDPTGKFAPLHKFNPVRLKFIRETAAPHFKREAKSLRPFEGLTLLDIGCGGGLLSEPTARLGFAVTGVDPSDKSVKIASTHASEAGLDIDYRQASAEALVQDGLTFDVVLNMEVVEHVADLRAYLEACAKLLKPGGLTVIATLNKTLKSLALAKIGAEFVLRWLPIGTHDWNKFVEPERLHALLEENGLTILKTQGVTFDPLSWDWRLSNDTDVNYMVVAEK